MKLKIIYYIFIVAGLIAFSPGCRPETGLSNTDSRYDDIRIPKTKNGFRDTAIFLGALPSGNNVSWHGLTETHQYEAYKKSVERSWENFFKPNLSRIEGWTSSNLPSRYVKTIFYPFSGPDILNPLAFYPESRDIIMFGLEPTGGIPDLTSMPRQKILPGLNELLPAINFMLDHAFFITTEMEKSVGKTPLSGITAIMVFFLARGGYQVMDINLVHIDEKGKLLRGEGMPVKGCLNGVEIIFFRNNASQPKRVRYFQINIADGSPQLGRFSEWLRGQSPFSTIIKSASYLMHNSNFSAIRDIVLSHSSSILQDDSGIPYTYLKKNKDWEIRLFGKYHRPLPVFKERYQVELEKDLADTTGEPLPFVYGYGYGYGDMTYHLLLATRREHTADYRAP